jgi:hypothetical protein
MSTPSEASLESSPQSTSPLLLPLEAPLESTSSTPPLSLAIETPIVTTPVGPLSSSSTTPGPQTAVPCTQDWGSTTTDSCASHTLCLDVPLHRKSNGIHERCCECVTNSMPFHDHLASCPLFQNTVVTGNGGESKTTLMDPFPSQPAPPLTLRQNMPDMQQHLYGGQPMPAPVFAFPHHHRPHVSGSSVPPRSEHVPLLMPPGTPGKPFLTFSYIPAFDGAFLYLWRH